MIHLLAGVIREEIALLKRYPFNTVSAVATMYIIFLMLFFGAKSAVGMGVDLGDSISSLVVSYWVLVITTVSFQQFGFYLSEQAKVGTLEQLYLSPYGFGWIACGKMLGVFTYNVAVSAPFLFLLMLTTGKWLHVDLLSVVPLVLANVLQAYGIGFLLGGLTLVHKRMEALFQLVTMLLVACIALPTALSPWVRLLPLNVTWRLLRTVMAEGVSIGALPGSDLAFVAIQTLTLFGLGWIAYLACEKSARRRGALGQY